MHGGEKEGEREADRERKMRREGSEEGDGKKGRGTKERSEKSYCTYTE